MSVLIKISATAVIFLCLSVILKSYRPEYVFLMRIIAVLLIFAFILDDISVFISDLISIFSVLEIDSTHIKLLLKVTGISVITDFVYDTLKENGDSSLAGVISLSSKFIVLYMALPIINSLIIFCLKFLE